MKKNPSHTKCLLFLDEVQATPAGIAALRYFYEERSDLPVIAAGSLLEFALQDFNYSIPVGRIEYRYIGPLRFHEYLKAAGEDFLVECLNKMGVEGISESAHQKLVRLQREYLFVGGMPEVVRDFLDSGDHSLCQRTQGALIQTFRDDFAKYASGTKLLRLQRVFTKIPGIIGQKVKYVNLSKDEKSREIRGALEQLIMAQLCHPVIHSDCTGHPLSASQDEDAYKLIFVDVGLMNKALGTSWHFMENLDERTLVNEGPIAEQFIGQELLYRHRGREQPALNYWLREKKATNAEVDYVLGQNNSILPIEVKSGKSGSLRSLLLFADTKSIPVGIRFDLNSPTNQEIKVADRIFTLKSLPLYAVSSLDHDLCK